MRVQFSREIVQERAFEGERLSNRYVLLKVCLWHQCVSADQEPMPT